MKENNNFLKIKRKSKPQDIIVMYISKNGTLGYWKEKMDKFITGQKLELIIGNFNYCYQTIP